MQLSQVEQDEMTLGAGVTRRVLAMRLLAGLAQGGVLYWLYRANHGGLWPATDPYWMVPLLMTAVLLPVLLISSLGHLAPKKAALWMLAALAILLALSLHDVWRDVGSPEFERVAGQNVRYYFPSFLLVVFGGGLFFIAHAMVLAAAQDRRYIASYASYFEAAWKLGIQLNFSAWFVGVLWLVLWMGGALFHLVKLDFLRTLLETPWFAVPVSCFGFACAMHITDMRPAIVRGIRTLLLVLMSWLLPVAALIVTGFLCSLPFTGLVNLWQTRHAAAVLLAASAVLVVLINAAFQNGRAGAGVAGVVRASARAASILLLPLTAVAVYAVALRVHQYGWTNDRIIASACLLVASCYAAGYALAAYQYDTWLELIAPVNVAAAFMVMAVLLALFTPIADPARIAVNDQMARLESGRTGAAQFDVQFLRFEGKRYGRAALDQLMTRLGSPDAALLSQKAAKALAQKNRWDAVPELKEMASLAANVQMWPTTAKLPANFLAQHWDDLPGRALPDCLLKNDAKCDGFLIDMDGDGRPEVVLADGQDSLVLFAEQPAGVWTVAGRSNGGASACGSLLDMLKAGQAKAAPARIQDLDVGGLRLQFVRPFDANRPCPQP